MRKIVLGNSNFLVSAVGLGCSRLGSTIAGSVGEDADRLIKKALELGINWFDTANIYGQGDSEKILGRSLGEKRKGAVLITKGGQKILPAHQVFSKLKAPIRALAKHIPQVADAVARRRAVPLQRDYSCTHLRDSIEASLLRLNTTYIDIFLLHSPMANELEETNAPEMLDSMVSAGNIRLWGVSCDNQSSLRTALGIPSVRVLQLPLSLALNGESSPLISVATRRGVGVLLRGLGAERGLAESAVRRQALAKVFSLSGAAALIGTTSPDHLEAIVADSEAAWP